MAQTVHQSTVAVTPWQDNHRLMVRANPWRVDVQARNGHVRGTVDVPVAGEDEAMRWAREIDSAVHSVLRVMMKADVPLEYGYVDREGGMRWYSRGNGFPGAFAESGYFLVVPEQADC